MIRGLVLRAVQQTPLFFSDEIFAADYQHHDPANPDPRPMIGSQAVKDHLTSLKGAFPDLQFEIDDIVV